MTVELEQELYDAIGRAIANLHAALADINAAWVVITSERAGPSVEAFTALDAAEEVLEVARADLARARAALDAYSEEKTRN
jgi:predicted trehalose synthase